MSFFSKLKEKFAGKQDKAVYLSGFEKSKNTFSDALNQMGSSFHGVDDDFLEQLTIVLLESDVGIELADLICERLKKKCDEYPGITFHWAMNFLLEIMKDIYDEIPDAPIVFNDNGPTVILLEGVNGSGKTTTAAKLASMYTDQGKKVALVAADTFRAGAIDQLAEWGERLNCPVIKGRENGDPSAAIVDGCRFAKEKGADILVLDATTGQNGLTQAQVFAESTKLTGIILSKMDGTAKGGIILAIKYKLHLPVYFIGLGEHPEDLRPFDLDSYLYSISEGLKDVQ